MMVYRVEHKSSGRGPYYMDEPGKSNALSNCLFDHFDRERHPTAWEDGIEGISSPFFGSAPGWRFGFRSIDQLKHWFSDHERDLLARDGYHVAVYKVAEQHIKYGLRQVVFEADYATRKRVMIPNRLAVA